MATFRREYVRSALETMTATPEEILSGSLDQEIRTRLCSVIEAEGPVMEELLFKRVLNSLSLRKLGSRLLPVFRRISSSLPYDKTEDRGSYVWHNGEAEDFFRPSPDPEDRYSYQIPTQEAAACLAFLLEREGKALTRSKLLGLFKKEMGYERAGSQVENLFLAALKSDRIERTRNGRYKAI